MIADRWMIAYAKRVHGVYSASRIQHTLASGGPLAGLLRRSIYWEMMHPEYRELDKPPRAEWW